MKIKPKKVDLPEVYELKQLVKEQQLLIGKLNSEIDDLTYKNGVLIKKGKELYKKLSDIVNSPKSEKNKIVKSIKSEELYKNVHAMNKSLMDNNRKYKKEIKELIYKLAQYGYNNFTDTVRRVIEEREDSTRDNSTTEREN